MAAFANFPATTKDLQAAVIAGGVERKVFDIDADLEVIAAIAMVGIDTNAVIIAAMVITVVSAVAIVAMTATMIDTAHGCNLIADAVVAKVADVAVHDEAITVVVTSGADFPDTAQDFD